jgi:positive regulator of sigma E activity
MPPRSEPLKMAPEECSEQAGTVIGIEREVATIRVELDKECAGCSHKSGCHDGVAGPTISWPIRKTDSWAIVGGRVRLAKGPDRRLSSVGLAYLLPALTLVGGAFVGSMYGGDVAEVLGAGIGLAFGALLVVAVGRTGVSRGWWRLDIEPMAVHEPTVVQTDRHADVQ